MNFRVLVAPAPSLLLYWLALLPHCVTQITTIDVNAMTTPNVTVRERPITKYCSSSSSGFDLFSSIKAGWFDVAVLSFVVVAAAAVVVLVVLLGVVVTGGAKSKG